MSALAAGDIQSGTTRKLRARLIPLLFILYVVSYLDRINISFAGLTMNAALGISSGQFGLLVSMFFWGYLFFQIPSNLVLHKIGARVWICCLLLSWGLAAMLCGAAQNVPQLYVMRFVLGAAEAGFFPGIVLYLTYWFRRHEQARMISLFMTGLPVASILGAPASGYILDHAHWAGISTWRWLLMLEGLPAIICGFLTYFILPSRPVEANFLTQGEKDWIAGELAGEQKLKAGERSMSALHALAHPRVWHLAIVGFTFAIALYTMSFYMPQAVKSLSTGYSNTTVGVLVMVPHLAGLIAMVLVSRSSDRRLERRYHSAFSAMVGGAALLLLGTTSSALISIVLWSFAAIGIYGFLGPFWSIPSEFLTGFSAASGIALINSAAGMGGVAGPAAIGALAGKTGGIYGGLAFAGASLFVSAALILRLPAKLASR